MPAWPLVPLPQSVSAGSIERLVACPFRFLVQDGWRLREPDEPVDVPGARERGEFVHEVLEAFHREAAAAGLEPIPSHRDALRDLLQEVTGRLARAALDAGGGYLGEIAVWRALVDAYLDWLLADAQDGWRWREGEQSLQVLVPWQDDGTPKALQVSGRLDRLDAAPGGLRIIDYKLGDPARLTGLARDPSRAAQLVLYAWMAAGRGPVAMSAYLSLRRDGIRLIPLDGPPADAIASWQRVLPRYLARIARGEPLAAIGSDCSHCASRGVCRKGHWS
jgi:ATP-dependent helicase/nuclease subunit B